MNKRLFYILLALIVMACAGCKFTLGQFIIEDDGIEVHDVEVEKDK